MKALMVKTVEVFFEELGQQIDSITDSMDIRFTKLQEIVKDRKAWCAAVHGVAKIRT